MNIFISQPMNGLSDEELFIQRRAAESRIYKYVHILPDNWPNKVATDRDICFLHNIWEETYSHRLQYLGRSISLMSAANLIVFATGWEKARGCCVEQLTAKLYEIPMLMEHGDRIELWAPGLDKTIVIKKEASDEYTRPAETV